MNGLTLSWKRIFAQWNTEHKIFTNSLQYLLNLCTHENPQSKHRIFLIERCPWYIQDFPGISASKESTCNAGDLDLIPGLGSFPWGRERLPTSVFWPREFHGLYSPWDHKELDMTEQLSLSLHP